MKKKTMPIHTHILYFIRALTITKSKIGRSFSNDERLLRELADNIKYTKKKDERGDCDSHLRTLWACCVQLYENVGYEVVVNKDTNAVQLSDNQREITKAKQKMLKGEIITHDEHLRLIAEERRGDSQAVTLW